MRWTSGQWSSVVFLFGVLPILLLTRPRRSPTSRAGSCETPRWGLLLALTLCVSCGGATGEDLSLTRPELTSRRLTTTGTWLIDALGRKVLLRGVNAGGRAKMPPFAPFDYEEGEFDAAADAYFEGVAGLGSNVVRLMLSWEALEPTEGVRDLEYWGRYVAMIHAAHAHGIGVIVDFHQDVYASPFCGDGFPLWTLGSLPHGEPRYDCQFFEWPMQYYSSSSSVNQAFERLWTNEDGIRTKLGAMWRFVASELRDHPGIVGFEPINEPGVGTGPRETLETSVLPAFYEEIGGIIEEEAGAAVIFGGSTAGDSTVVHSLVRPALDHFVFAPHSYDALGFIGITNANYDRLRRGTITSITWSGQDSAPTIVGEWGLPNTNSAKAAYLDVLLDIYDELNLNAVHWDAHVSATKWNNEDFTTFHPDGSEQSWAGSLDRPFPRAVSGEDLRFSFDRAAVHFTAEVTNAGTAVSEFYLPVRRFGTAPSIVVRGARFRYLAEHQLLLVRAGSGASYSVDVLPTP